MIVEYPTALYDTVLPKQPSDDQSITFLISSTNPPRSEQIFQQLPFVEEVKILPDRVTTWDQNRDAAGSFVFSISRPAPGESGSVMKQFEVGQTLEFEPTVNIPTLEIELVPDTIDLVQNTNLLDFNQTTLTQDEVNYLVSQAQNVMRQIIAELNVIKAAINDNETLITQNQKSINEIQKMLKAARVVLSSGTETSDILTKLENQLTQLGEERTALISQTNEYINQSEEKYQELLNARELVR